MNQTPLVTCILPTYNRREFIPNAIRLFLDQSYQNKELVIIDDGTDSVQDIVQAVNHPQIRYSYWPEKMAIGRKRNIGCELARGVLIAHWDDDDYYHPLRLEEQVKILLQSDRSVTGYNSVYFYNAKADRAIHYYEDPNTLVGATLLYRRAYWNAHRFPDVQIGEDTYFMRRVPSDQLIGTSGLNRFVIVDGHGSNVSDRNFDEWLARYPEVRIEAVRGVVKPFKPVSVVLGCVSWNTSDVTRDTIDGLKAEAARLNALGHQAFICAVDNGSGDGTQKWLRRHELNKLILNKTNRGNSFARNQIIDYARKQDADYILFIDGDIQPIPGSIYAMVSKCESGTLPAATGCLGAYSGNQTKNPSHITQSITSIPDSAIEQGAIAWTQYGVFRKEVFNSIKFTTTGPLSKAGWGFEDDDYFYQMVEAGFESVAFNHVVYLHRNMQSSCVNLIQAGEDPAELFNARKQQLIDTWGSSPRVARYLNPKRNMTFRMFA